MPPDRDEIVAKLRAHEAELRALGIESVSLFGSVARGEAGDGSDVDLAAKLVPKAAISLFDFVGLQLRMGTLIGREVDLIKEPAERARLQQEIDRDRVLAF